MLRTPDLLRDGLGMTDKRQLYILHMICRTSSISLIDASSDLQTYCEARMMPIEFVDLDARTEMGSTSMLLNATGIHEYSWEYAGVKNFRGDVITNYDNAIACRANSCLCRCRRPGTWIQEKSQDSIRS
jgi:hypothetical protein